MRILHTVLVITTASAFIVRRDFTTVFNDIKKIYSDAVSLDNAVKSFDGSNAGPTINAYTTLDNDITQATKDTNASPTATNDQASSVLTYIKTSLIPIISTTLNDVVAKKSSFNSGGFGCIVLDDLKQLKSDSGKLGTALIAKAPASYSSSASSANSVIQSLFNSGIAAYGPSPTPCT